MTKECIEREAVIDLITRRYENPEICKAEINAIHSADVVPVVHGRWENANNRPKTYERRCTACGGIAYFCGKGCSYKFCPNCGAKMEG